MSSETGIPGVSIVIPAWNDEDRLARTPGRYLPLLGARAEPFEVMSVNGVRDQTAAVAAGCDDSHVRVLRFSHEFEGKRTADDQGQDTSRKDCAVRVAESSSASRTRKELPLSEPPARAAQSRVTRSNP